MAGDWISLKTGLESRPATWRIAAELNLSIEVTLFQLYRLACWFKEQGKYGKLAIPPSAIDTFLGIPGFVAVAQKVEYIIEDEGVLMISVQVADVSAGRKSLGRKVRHAVLGDALCAICGTTEGLVIDHIVPIVRGGSCETSNLQALCAPCNRAKGRKTMAEFAA